MNKPLGTTLCLTLAAATVGVLAGAADLKVSTTKAYADLKVGTTKSVRRPQGRHYEYGGQPRT